MAALSVGFLCSTYIRGRMAWRGDVMAIDEVVHEHVGRGEGNKVFSVR